VFPGEGGERNVSFSFVWCPHWRISKPLDVLKSLAPPVTHVVYTIGRYYFIYQWRYVDCRWLAWDDPETLEGSYREFLETMKEEFGDTLQHIIIRTVPSIVSVPTQSTFLVSLFVHPYLSEPFNTDGSK
jgi:hypothetical protein